MDRPPDHTAAEDRVIVLAPFGQDGRMAADILSRAGMACVTCRTVQEVCAEIGNGAGAVLIAYEALSAATLDTFAAVLEDQPPWSDLPILIVMPATASASKARILTFEGLRNVTLLERPIRITTLVSTMQTALRARRRQYLVRTLMEELRRSNQTKDAFLAAVSHELRTPLNAIRGWTRVARQSDEPSRVLAALDVLERNGTVLSQLVEDLLDVARIEHGQFRLEMAEVDVADVVTAAADVVRPAADRKQIQLALDCSADTPGVIGDAIRLQQVIWNLLWNAVKFTPDGGRITVNVRGETRRVDERRTTPRAVEIQVIDTGFGISPDQLPFVFDPFRKAHDAGRSSQVGLGLGLAIVKHLVELHGGSVTAHSDGSHRGATFRVRLPSVDQRAAPKNESAAASAHGADDVAAIC